MNLDKEKISSKGYDFLRNIGIFYVKDFVSNKKILDDIYFKVKNYLNKIDSGVTKKYENYFVENKYSLLGSNVLHKRNLTTFNFRGLVKNKIKGKNGNYSFDNGFCDIIHAELLFPEIKKIDFTNIFDN